MEQSKKNDVYYSIRQGIISGELKQGEILNEGELAKKYGVSRTPVREALLMLTFEGLVNALPRAGYMVTQITIRDVQEAFHLREILEVEAVRLATDRITQEEMKALHEYAVGVNPGENPIFNHKFHLIIARASGNRRLARLIEQILDEMERLMVLDPLVLDPFTPNYYNEHFDILIALQNHDTAAAQDAMRIHIREAKNRILQRF